jgi:hypothetical protein
MSGTPAPLTVTIDVPAGQDTVRLTLCRSLPDSLDFQNWYPNPASESGSSSTVSYSFEAQQGLSLRVRLDARSQPNLSPGVTDCDVTAQSGSATATVTFSIWVLP